VLIAEFCALIYIPKMTGASKEKTESIVQKKIGGTSILSVLYSFAKKIGTVAVVYLMGYFELSVAWLIGPVILSVIRDEWKKEKELRRNVAKAAALCNEKEVILARVDDLPSWVRMFIHQYNAGKEQFTVKISFRRRFWIILPYTY
jgi:uncharacterized membrane protein (Fun14 family)